MTAEEARAFWALSPEERYSMASVHLHNDYLESLAISRHHESMADRARFLAEVESRL